jgi:outer membrane receptor protein involved in Fe transport
VDPRRGGETLGDFNLVQGGAPDLKPEDSTTWSIGAVLTPTFWKFLRASADWTHIDKNNAITTLNWFDPAELADLINFAPDHIIRGPVPPGDPFAVGPITQINAGFVNVAKTRVDALDLAVDFAPISTSAGDFSADFRATDLIHSYLRVAPNSPLVENSGVAGNVRWRANGTFNWVYSQWNVSWTVRYFDGYFLNPDHSVVASQGSASIPAQFYNDLYVSYRFDPDDFGWIESVSGVTIEAGVNNLFNVKPPIDVTTDFSRLGDPRLANYYISLRKSL